VISCLSSNRSSFLLLRKTKLLRERDRLLLRKTRRSTSAIRGMEDGERTDVRTDTRLLNCCCSDEPFSTHTHTLSLSLSLSLSVATFPRTFPVANRRSGSSLLCLRVVAQAAAEDVSDCYWVSGKIDKCLQILSFADVAVLRRNTN
jgi:hypothetical protein